MSTSPCCSMYKFPADSPAAANVSYEYCQAPHSESIAPFLASQVAPNDHVTLEGGDYFAMAPTLQPKIPTLPPKERGFPKPTFVSPRKPPARCPSNNLGSVSLLCSDATLVEHAPLSNASHDFNLSTDTLLEEPLGLPLLLPPFALRRLSLKSVLPTASPTMAPVTQGSRNKLLLSLNMAATAGARRAPRHASGSLLPGTRPVSLRGDSLPLATSAVEMHFEETRKYSLAPDDAEIGLSHTKLLVVPPLRKQLTLPAISPFGASLFFEAPRGTSRGLVSLENFREQILALSPLITYLPPLEIAALINSSFVDPETGLRDLLPLDIRTFADHVNSHLTGSINVCLPLTLLKRLNFDLKRCVNSLPAYEKAILLNYFYQNKSNVESGICIGNSRMGPHGLPGIVLYDNTNRSGNIFHMCKKLIDQLCFDATSFPPIYLIDGPTQALSQAHPEAFTSGRGDMVNIDTLPFKVTSLPMDFKTATESAQISTPVRCAPLRSLDCGMLTPNVCNFSLPTNLPETKFKIRHNEEKFNFSSAPCAEDKLSTLSVSTPCRQLLPAWLQKSVEQSAQIRVDFNKLEECEKSRLNCALRMLIDREFRTPGGKIEQTPVINTGLDYGHKNRYKDIFLYEHSRVSLNDVSTERELLEEGAGQYVEKQQVCDYINASYLKPAKAMQDLLEPSVDSRRALKQSSYIATQGPLEQTAGDFWHCIMKQRTIVIVSLTKEFENGVEKCFPYWKLGLYTSGDCGINVKLQREESFGALSIRTFELTSQNHASHRAIQLHLDSWEDMGVAVNVKDVLSMIELKNHILAKFASLPLYPTITHCSAGCGRTGVFVAADMLINALLARSQKYDLSVDPIYDVVNDLRKQRILMVQTMRQYGSIYNILIRHILEADQVTEICNADIAKEFMNGIK